MFDGPYVGYVEFQLATLTLYWIDAPGVSRDYVTKKEGIPVHLVAASADFSFIFGIYDQVFSIPLCETSLKLHLEVDKNGKRAHW